MQICVTCILYSTYCQHVIVPISEQTLEYLLEYGPHILSLTNSPTDIYLISILQPKSQYWGQHRS